MDEDSAGVIGLATVSPASRRVSSVRPSLVSWQRVALGGLV